MALATSVYHLFSQVTELVHVILLDHVLATLFSILSDAIYDKEHGGLEKPFNRLVLPRHRAFIALQGHESLRLIYNEPISSPHLAPPSLAFPLLIYLPRLRDRSIPTPLLTAPAR